MNVAYWKARAYLWTSVLFILSAGINFTRLLNGAVKTNTFCRRKVLAKQEATEEKEIGLKDSSIHFSIN